MITDENFEAKLVDPRPADPKLEDLRQVLASLARGELTARCALHGAGDPLDPLGLAINVLAETLAANRDTRTILEAVRSKDEFLASMSHDLRTPLNAILGLSEALQEQVYGPLTDKQRRSIQTIEHSGRQLLEMVSGMIDLAKIGIDELELELHDIELDDLCRQVLRILRPKARAGGLKLRYINSSEVEHMRGDARRVRQILLNLLSNAIRFTPPGGEAGLELTDSSEQAVAFVVWDTGEGFDMEAVHPTHGSLEPGRTELTRKHRGANLDLSLASRLTALHGGRIEIDSERGRGSRFTVVLPATPPQQSGDEPP
ncbi:MAG: HAMP domain-containing sensor histidine kinase [Myxococcota bacterium]